ncbi:alpha/beta fold hydrolase [Niallia sp. 03133]|uniref:alpha/beta fold hydrolase n=1 Tax=Niallia sp. 03133 TaxID=3458060 RepID=UPI004044D9A8
MSNNLTIFRKNGNEQPFIEAYEEVLKLWPVPYEEIMISTRFGQTHLIAAGPKDAEPLILIHGMAFSATMWYPNIESLAGRYRVFALDTIGDIGKGIVTKIMKTRQNAVEWIDDVLIGLNLTSAYFIGHSMGGWISMNYAIQAPEKVKKLVLLAPAAGIHKVTPKFLLKVYPAILFPSESRLQKALSWFLSPYYQSNEQLDKLIHQFVISGMNCIPRMKVVPTVFSVKELQNLSVETLLLVGEYEVIYNPRKMVEKAKHLWPNLTYEIVQESGHGLSFEQPEIINEAVMSFLWKKNNP